MNAAVAIAKLVWQPERNHGLQERTIDISGPTGEKEKDPIEQTILSLP
jgi:hypothetical protein